MGIQIRLALALVGLAQAPAALAQEDYRSPTTARGVVETYYAAIVRGAFRAAYRLWAGNGRASGKSYSYFSKGFAATV